MTSILVTGGAGFIGSNFVHLILAQTDWTVVVLDRLTYAGHRANLADVDGHSRLVFRRGDIADREAVRALYREFEPRLVAHFAAESHVDRSIDAPAVFLGTNVLGTFELLEAARLQLAERPDPGFRFLHVSTDEVYGSLGGEGAFSETTPYAPNSPYAASKAAADHLVRSWFRTYGLPTLTTNCTNNYGPYQYPEKLIPLMLLNALDGRRLPVYGQGLNVRDWLYVEDHCRGLLRVLESGVPGETYCFGGRAERTNLEVVATLCRLLEEIRPAAGNPRLTERGVAAYEDLRELVADRPGHDLRYAMDVSKVRAALDWSPTVSFEEGLRRTIAWYLEHPDWCREVQQGRYRRERLGLATGAAGE
jgi:dTDP-glucose 4,6-dehydratase